jgi:hypothetical protein
MFTVGILFEENRGLFGGWGRVGDKIGVILPSHIRALAHTHENMSNLTQG